jgi:hypothetical protein
MVWSFVAASNGAMGGTTNPYAIPRPAGRAIGDRLITFLFVSGIGPTPSITIPGTWIQKDQTADSGGAVVTSWYETTEAPGDPSTDSWAYTTGLALGVGGFCLAYRAIGANDVGPNHAGSGIATTLAGVNADIDELHVCCWAVTSGTDNDAVPDAALTTRVNIGDETVLKLMCGDENCPTTTDPARTATGTNIAFIRSFQGTYLNAPAATPGFGFETSTPAFVSL